MKSKHELEDLIQAYLDGVINTQQSARLNALLEHDVDARRTFSERLNLDSMIAAAAAGWIPEAVAPPRRKSPLSMARRLLAIAAGLLLVASSVHWWRRAPQSLARTEFARVEKSLGVHSLPVGSHIFGEQHQIEMGTVEVVTALGARLVIEAPAEFRFENAQLLHMGEGRLAADVPPPATGFTVITPSGEVVDLGTSFGLDVPRNEAAEVHVFEGEVVATATGAKTERNLLAGDALTMQDGVGTSRTLRTAAFIKADEMRELDDQRARSEAALDDLRLDPALIALLDFESDEPSHPGIYRAVQGRWPGSRAAEFVNIGDHLKLDVGGHRAWPQLTLAAWVRLDQLGSPYQSLLHTDDWDRGRSGQVHWMINEATTMRLALFGNVLAPGADESQPFPDSRTPVLSDRGRWIHLATVYDASQGAVRFFVNGRFDKESRQSIAHPAQLGSAQIGNWNQQERTLSGRLDELMILGRAMNDDEVRTLFHGGNPYR